MWTRLYKAVADSTVLGSENHGILTNKEKAAFGSIQQGTFNTPLCRLELSFFSFLIPFLPLSFQKPASL